MSLINDTDFIIHSLRLSYLRDVDDPYGPRLITLDPSYNSNPYIMAALLADEEKWPELTMPSSPQISEDEAERPSEFPGARLKHTQTIMGGRSGGLGMRVHGKRASTSKRISGTPVQVDVQNFAADNTQFIPKFKGAAEMEARRQMRMAARRGPGDIIQAQPLQKNLDFSSSEEEIPLADESPESDFDDDVPGEADSTDGENDFDLDFDAGRTRTLVDSPPSETLFARKKVPPLKPLKSALSAMLASADASSNPFAEMYAAISGRGESASADVIVYFPHAMQPRGKEMKLNVRKDATVEEVIGFALWTYWKEGWSPKLDEGLSGEDDPKWATKVSAVGWILRIAEDDGEVDDDFPPPDRLGKISKFNADAYAVLEATLAQVQQNQLIESKIQRLPSRMTKKVEKLVTPGSGLPSTAGPSSAVLGSMLGSVPLSTSLGPSSSQGPPIFLRIRVADTVDAVHISTTIPVSAGMYMQEALELVCKKRNSNPKDHALLLADKSILIPLDRTVASLQGKRELLLVKRSVLPQIGGDILKGTGKTTDPNASIFKRMSDIPEVQYPSLADYAAGYKRFTIFRKAPMLLARQERVLAIDGVYIHIMPSKAMKAVFDSGKTSSYHIKSIADCQQSAKTSSVFKLILSRGGANKRYDFEAESPRLAGEIVQTIKSLKASLERSGTVSKSRRSRHVG